MFKNIIRFDVSIMPKYMGKRETLAPSYIRAWVNFFGNWKPFTITLPKF